jgi:hypothetical protein
MQSDSVTSCQTVPGVAGAAPLQVHAGMYHGVQRHLGTIQSDIVAATAQLASRISDDLPGRTSQVLVALCPALQCSASVQMVYGDLWQGTFL